MKKTQEYYIHLSVLIGLIIALISSCQKGDNDTSNNTFTDPRDGNIYHTVTIGTQVWMVENLRYLPNVVGSETGSETIPYYYVYGYDGISVTAAKATSNYTNYGVLYNWPAAKSACPAGWHLPNDEEWIQLTDYLGGETSAGGKLKELGTIHWISPNTGATNETGFSALPGGYRDYNGSFYNLGGYGGWWCAPINAAYTCLNRDMGYNYTKVNRYGRNVHDQMLGFSVRCIKD